MTTTPAAHDGYSAAFTRLCHLVALSRDGQLETAVGCVVKAVLGLGMSKEAATAEGVTEAANVLFGLALHVTDVRTAIDRLVERGTATRIDGHWSLIPAEQAKVDRQVDDARALEERVYKEWLSACPEVASSPDLGTVYRSALRRFTARVLERHGAQSASLLAPDRTESGAPTTTLQQELAAVVDSAPPNCDKQMLGDAVAAFFRTRSADRTEYLAQMLNSTFTCYALSVNDAAAAFLSSQLKPLKVFLDTNFIFGLINLHVNPVSDVSSELLTIIKDNKLPFQLYYHEETLKEIRRTIDSHHDRMRQFRYSPALSRAVVHSGRVGGIELKYHQLNAETPVSVDDFFAKFNHVDVILSSLGCKIYRPSKTATPTVDEKGPIIAEYDEFVKKSRPDRPRQYAALDHDIVVWLTLQRIRGNPKNILDSGALFLTADYSFFRFDWQILREHRKYGTAILPSQLLQLMRAFVSDQKVDASLVSALSVPEFRASAPDFSFTVSHVIGVMATYADLDERTATQLLSSELLMSRIQHGEQSPEAIEAAIDSELLRENQELANQVEEITRTSSDREREFSSEIDSLRQRSDAALQIEREKSAADIAARSAELEQAIARARTAEATRDELEDRVSRLETRVEEGDERRKRSQTVATITGLALLLVIATGVAFSAVHALSVHPRRALMEPLVACLECAALWMIVSTNHRWSRAFPLVLALATLVVGTIYY
jgi:hypothetical protein